MNMRKLLIRGGLSALGVVTALLWFSYGPKGKSVASQSHIPTKVGTGGQTLEIDAESSSPATMSVSFDNLSKPIGEQLLLNTWEKIPAGTHSWSIDVPAGVGGYIELDADHPNVGDSLTMRIHMNRKLVDEQSEKLNSPLEPNTAFFLQDHFDDYSNRAPEAGH
jgi:hypothetical protein